MRFVHVLLVAVLLAVVPSVSSASKVDDHFLYMSPRPGAILVNKGTTLTFRLRTPLPSTGDFPALTVSGTSSGLHTGEWIRTRDKTAMIFRPYQKFTPGEVVSVSVGLENEAATYQFTVSPKTRNLQSEVPECDCYGDDEWTDSPTARKDLKGKMARTPGGLPPPAGFPNFNINVNTSSAPGFVFFAPGTWLAIMDNNGLLCFFEERDFRVTDFKKNLSGQLTFFERNPTNDVILPRSKAYLMDNTYTVIDEYLAGNGYEADTDFHEFIHLPSGNAIFMIYDPQPVDMSVIVTGGDPNATVIGLVLQEMDPAHNVVFQWRSWDFIPITDSQNDLLSARIDYIHGNSIEVDTDGNWIISNRNLNEVTKINSTTGAIMWRLGGNANEFTMTAGGTFFTRQHDARRLPSGNISIYDNGNDSMPQESRAVEYSLVETGTKTATQVFEYRRTPVIFSPFTGSVRRQSNGNAVISWGNRRVITEIDNAGTVVWEMEMPAATTYRGFRDTWVGAVAAAPYLWITVNEMQHEATLNFVKFGDEDVAEYCIFQDTSPNPTTLVATTTENLWTTGTLDDNVTYYFRVTSKDSLGNESPYSNEEEVFIDPTVPVFIIGFSAASDVDGVDLRWDILSDEDIQGFNIYRRHGDDQPVVINPGGLIGVAQRRYMDAGTDAGKDYSYTLGVVLADGSELMSQTTRVTTPVRSLTLGQNHPNPFNPKTVISYQLPEAGFVELMVYDAGGRLVRTLVQENMPAGAKEVTWDGHDDAGNQVSSGVYFYRLTVGTQTLTRKMVMIK
ncbi:MAG: aryl-sulfate sulfotransferase [bacterium]|nr:aryl-sulfate sulfotransferase [bacterium]